MLEKWLGIKKKISLLFFATNIRQNWDPFNQEVMENMTLHVIFMLEY